MKFLRFSLIALLAVSVFSCSRDDDNNGSNQTDTLANYLNGTFNVVEVAYDGEIDIIIGTIPVSGIDTQPTGDYTFNRGNGTVSYDVDGTLSFTPPLSNDPVEVPIRVNSTNAPLNIVNETTFTIEDETWGLMTYEVDNRDANGMQATTRLASDTAGFDMEMQISFRK